MWSSVFIVFAKEVRDNARDRRSLLVALVYPLLGPILLGLLLSAAVGMATAQPGQKLVLAVGGMENSPEMAEFLDRNDVVVVPAPVDPRAAVRASTVETVLIIPPGFSERFHSGQTALVTVIFNSSRLPGLIAVNQAKQLIGDFNREVLERRMSERGIDRSLLQPLSIKNVNVASGKQLAGLLLLMVPPLFIFNLFMGGVYLAMDTTSGERERGSLEPLLINPVARWGVMLGKYLAALFYTAVAVAAQLIAFRIIFGAVSPPDLGVLSAFNIGMIIGVFLTMLPLMMVAVGVQVIIATITRSYKEAQTYLGLLPLIPAIPGMVLVFAPVQAQGWMMSVPIFSQTLILGQLVRGAPVAFLDVAVSMSSSVMVSALLVIVAARLYERENLIFGN